MLYHISQPIKYLTMLLQPCDFLRRKLTATTFKRMDSFVKFTVAASTMSSEDPSRAKIIPFSAAVDP